MNYQRARFCAQILKAVGHPMRIRILEKLEDGEKCVCELLKLGTISQSNVSRHLAYLKKAGLVSDRREMNRVMYRLVVPEVMNLVHDAARAAQAAVRRQAREAAAV
jgi:DNA-binding transcriptional ArsR family regulator